MCFECEKNCIGGCARHVCQQIKMMEKVMEYQHGGDIYTNEGMLDFSVNVNPFGASEAVKDAVRDAAEDISNYPDSRCRKLRSALAEKLAVEMQETARLEEMLVFGNGAADLIYALVLAEKPRKAVLCAPSFLEYAQALQSVECKISFHKLKEEHQFRLDEDFLEELKPDVDLIFLCSPDNPSGQVIERKLFLRILEKCEQNHIRLVLDECFYEFLDRPMEMTMVSYVSAHPQLFLLRAFTKMAAIPGLRLGYGICADQDLLGRIEQIRQPWSVSVVAQAAGLAALQEKERGEEIRQILAKERKFLEQGLHAEEIEYIPSRANFILLKCPVDLYQELKNNHILIRDCANYEGLTKGYYRIAVRKREENEYLLQALHKIMCSYGRKTSWDLEN